MCIKQIYWESRVPYISVMGLAMLVVACPHKEDQEIVLDTVLDLLGSAQELFLLLPLPLRITDISHTLCMSGFLTWIFPPLIWAIREYED